MGPALRAGRVAVLPGAGLGSVSYADRNQTESVAFGCWPEGRCEMVDGGQTSEPPSFSWGLCLALRSHPLPHNGPHTPLHPLTQPGAETPPPPGCQVGPS